jgi:hypothetical protein
MAEIYPQALRSVFDNAQRFVRRQQSPMVPPAVETCVLMLIGIS